MRFFSSRAAFAVVLVAALSACAQPNVAHAEHEHEHEHFQHEHPHYMHALAELRVARGLLDRAEEFNVERDQFAAIGAIDAAMQEIRRAAFEEGRGGWEPPPVDPRTDRHGRLFKVIELLGDADRDLRFEEDDRAALGWRAAAVHHVEEARGAVDRAIRAKRWDEERRH